MPDTASFNVVKPAHDRAMVVSPASRWRAPLAPAMDQLRASIERNGYAFAAGAAVRDALAILYRTDILFSSIHGDPRTSFPYYSGHADETGEGEGAGFNLNIPLPDGAAWDVYREALAAALTTIRHYGPDLLIVSLGVDTFKGDPVGRFELDSPDFLRVGELIGELQMPTLFVMEGGYGVPQIGLNVANVLEGYLGTTR